MNAKMLWAYLWRAPINFVLVLLSYALAPFLAALSMAIGKPVLPGVLQWFSTLDNTLDGGIDDKVAGYGPKTGWGLWWQRTCWICRNPAHGWQSNLLGMSAEESVIIQRERVPQFDAVIFREWALMNDKRGRRFFSWRLQKALIGRWYVKLWFGWNPAAYDGRNHHYEFQIGLKRRK